MRVYCGLLLHLVGACGEGYEVHDNIRAFKPQVMGTFLCMSILVYKSYLNQISLQHMTIKSSHSKGWGKGPVSKLAVSFYV